MLPTAIGQIPYFLYYILNAVMNGIIFTPLQFIHSSNKLAKLVKEKVGGANRAISRGNWSSKKLEELVKR